MPFMILKRGRYTHKENPGPWFLYEPLECPTCHTVFRIGGEARDVTFPWKLYPGAWCGSLTSLGYSEKGHGTECLCPYCGSRLWFCQLREGPPWRRRYVTHVHDAPESFERFKRHMESLESKTQEKELK